MNFLALCNSLHSKTGESGAGLITVVAQTGYYGEVVDYVKNAWLDIQLKHPAWRFLRRQAAPTLVIGQNNLDADAWVVANLGSSIDEYHKATFSLYESAIGAANDETEIVYVPWERWKSVFGLEYDAGRPGRPIHVTIDPYTDNLIVGPTPDKNYTLAFEFAEQPVELTADSDTPRIISALHEVIVWNALEQYGMAEESKPQMERGRRYYKRYLNRLSRRELPEPSLAGPIA